MTVAASVLLVPGAWMGEWIWEPIVAALAEQGVRASTLTLVGLEADADPQRVAHIRMADHVRQVHDEVLRLSGQGPVVLVGHSYSSAVVVQVADALSESVARVVHIGGFVVEDGQSMIDVFSNDAAVRAEETAQIERDGFRWMPPGRAMLEGQMGLSPQDVERLAKRLRAHPGHTVLDAAVLDRPVEEQRTTYVSLSMTEDDAWAHAPEIARRAVDRGAWRAGFLRSAHWPMLSCPDLLVGLLVDEVRSVG